MNPYHYTDNDPINNTDPLGLRPGDAQFDQPECGGSGHTATLSRQGGPGPGAPQGTGEEVEHLPVFPCGDEGALPGWRPMPGAIPCTRGASDREIVQQCLNDVRAFAPDPKPDPGRIGSIVIAPTAGSTINGDPIAARVEFLAGSSQPSLTVHPSAVEDGGVDLFVLLAHELGHVMTPRLVTTAGAVPPIADRLVEVDAAWGDTFPGTPQEAMETITDCLGQYWARPKLSRLGLDAPSDDLTGFHHYRGGFCDQRETDLSLRFLE